MQLLVLSGLQVVVLGLSSRRSNCHHPQPLLKIASVSLWFFIFTNIAGWFLGSIGLPVIALFFLAAALLYSPGRPQSLMRQNSIAEVVSDSIMTFAGTETRTGVGEKEEDIELTSDEPEVVSDSSYHEETSLKQSSVQFAMPLEEHTQDRVTATPLSTPTQLREEEEEEEVDLGRVRLRPKKKTGRQVSQIEAEIMVDKRPSNQLFVLLITCCMVVVLWHHPLLLLLLAPLATWNTLMRLSGKFEVTYRATKYIISTKNAALTWICNHTPVIFPHPLPTLYNMYLQADKWVLHQSKEFVGRLVTGCMMTVMLVGSVGLSVLLVAQIHLELTNTVSLTVHVLNSSVADSPWIHRYCWCAIDRKRF